MDKEALEQYFKSDKSDWMIESNDFNWDEGKVNNFWKLIREHKMNRSDFNFDGYIFPKGNFNSNENTTHQKSIEKVTNFWEIEEKIKTFNKDASFLNTKFLGDINFSNVEFNGTVSFSNSDFYSLTDFSNCVFKESSSFYQSIFYGKVSFKGSIFKNNALFSNCNYFASANFRDIYFEKDVDFKHSVFLKTSSFLNTQFTNITDFTSSKFTENADFFGCAFFGYTYFIASNFGFKRTPSKNELEEENYKNDKIFSIDFGSAIFYKPLFMISSKFHFTTNFLGTSFQDIADLKESDFFKTVIFSKSSIYQNQTSKKKSIFKYINFHSVIDLSKIILPENFTFIRINLSNAVFFYEQELSEIRFKECTFKGRQRIKLETIDYFVNYNLPDKLIKAKMFFNSKESLYRGLKKNFENSRDWDLSGRAFYSEMEMKKWKSFFSIIHFKKKKNIIITILYNLIITPINIVLRFIEFVIYFLYGLLSGYTQSFIKPLVFLILTFIGGYFYYVHNNFAIPEAILTSISYSLPFVDAVTSIKEQPFAVRYFGILQSVLGIMLISFFILALRKRFKQ